MSPEQKGTSVLVRCRCPACPAVITSPHRHLGEDIDRSRVQMIRIEPPSAGSRQRDRERTLASSGVALSWYQRFPSLAHDVAGRFSVWFLLFQGV